MAQINIRMDAGLKERAEKLFDDLGMSMSTAFTIFVKAAIRERGLPFDVRLDDENDDANDPFYSESNMKVLLKSIADADAGKLTQHDLIEV